MVDKNTLSFLKDLSKNNSKEWFDANRKRYEAERKKFVEFTNSLIQSIASFDPSISGIEAKNAIFRINRDIRFSADKSPYKTNFGASISKGGKKSGYSGYYIHIQPGQIFAGGGVYAPSPEVLKAVRDEIYFNLDSFEKILQTKTFKAQFDGLDDIDKLKTAPKGYEKDHPSIPYLMHKHFVVSRSFSDSELTSPDFLKNLVNLFKAQKPFIDFMNQAIDNQSN